MNYLEAIKEVCKGKTVRLPHWREDRGLIWYKNHPQDYYKNTNSHYTHKPTKDSINSLEWEVIKLYNCSGSNVLWELYKGRTLCNELGTMYRIVSGDFQSRASDCSVHPWKTSVIQLNLLMSRNYCIIKEKMK